MDAEALINNLEFVKLKPYQMTEREENQMTPFIISQNDIRETPAETKRIFAMREYLIFLTISKNPEYQVDSFAAQRLAELMYDVKY